LYPTIDDQGSVLNLKSFKPEPHLKGLYQYLMDNTKLVDIKKSDEKLMNIRTDQVLDMIQQGPGDWEQLVPSSVAAMIKENALFGFPTK
jgi:pyoverdine/dityrosine biosynthesis protein Dit1